MLHAIPHGAAQQPSLAAAERSSPAWWLHCLPEGRELREVLCGTKRSECAKRTSGDDNLEHRHGTGPPCVNDALPATDSETAAEAEAHVGRTASPTSSVNSAHESGSQYMPCDGGGRARLAAPSTKTGRCVFIARDTIWICRAPSCSASTRRSSCACSVLGWWAQRRA
jgi:hypothetical protein